MAILIHFYLKTFECHVVIVTYFRLFALVYLFKFIHHRWEWLDQKNPENNFYIKLREPLM